MGGGEIKQCIETSLGRVCLCADGVIEVHWNDDAVIELPHMDEVLAAQVQLTSGPAVVLVDSRSVRSMTREAQERSANTASHRDTRAVAILIGSPVSALLGNFFLTLARPVYPTKLFRDVDKARAWALGYLPERT